MTIWNKFNYNGALDEGIYWFVIEGPEWEVDEYGAAANVIGVIGTTRRVMLGYLTWDDWTTTGALPVIEAVDTGEDRDLNEEETVTHWAAVEKPLGPRGE